MIYSLKGTVQEITPAYVVLDVGGVGYYAAISLQTAAQLTAGASAFLYTQLVVREDAHLLYGFFTRDEKELFNLLVSVSGVGPASALIMLSSLANEEIASAIINGQSAVLQRVKGIGTKTAERIVIDLRDKIQKFSVGIENFFGVNDTKVKSEALSALEVLGIPKKISEKTADRILKVQQDITVEDLVKQILKSL